MTKNSNIQWTDHTINFWIGCVKKNEACKYCYAELYALRFMGPNYWGKDAKRYVTKNSWVDAYKYNKEAAKEGIKYKVFCNSLSDFFEDNIQINDTRTKAWEVIKNTKNLTWLILTKCPENIEKFLPPDWGNGYENVALGVTVAMKKHIPMAEILISIPAQYRFISCEPLLDYPPMGELLSTGKINWVIVGGESGIKKNVRRFNIEWAKRIKNLCKKNKIAFFMKQIGARPVYNSAATQEIKPYKIAPHDRIGGDINIFPPELKVREFPF